MERPEEERDGNLSDGGSRDEPDERRTSKLAILSVVLGISSVLFFALTGIPAILTAIISIYMIRTSVGTLKGTPVALAGIVISILSMFVFFLFWRLDAPPIPNDYTVADLRSAPPQCAESFEILKLLLEETTNVPAAPAIGLTEDDLDMSAEIRGVIGDANSAEISETLRAHADEIEQAWTRMQGARDVIKRLNAFAEIADLTELSVDGKIIHVRNLIELTRFYQVYGYLQIDRRNIQTFAAELIELDSIYRKLSVNVRIEFLKLTCFMCVNENIVTANAIVNNSRTPISTVELLAKHFVALTQEQLSLRNLVLSRYITFKNISSDMLASAAAMKVPFLKPNSTLRFYRNSCGKWFNTHRGSGEAEIAILSVWPAFYPSDEPDPNQDNTLVSFVYRCYNPRGFLNTSIMSVSRETILPKNITNISVQDDLFQIVLNKRLGREVSLKARDYGDEYIVDIENKRIFSPGPDGKTGTKDDIKLSINPEVLGWSYSTPR